MISQKFLYNQGLEKNNTLDNNYVFIRFRTDPRNITGLPVRYSSAPVMIERKTFLDEWEDSMRPLTTMYYTKIRVKYDMNYIFRVSLNAYKYNS